MLRTPWIASAALLLTAILLDGIASAQTNPMPPDYSGVHIQVPGVFVTPVASAPFSADVRILTHVALPDGAQAIRTTVTHIARDSSGRIYNERRRLVPTTYKGEPMLIEGHIFDPTTRLNTYYDPATRIARSAVLPPAVAARQMPIRPPVPVPFTPAFPGTNNSNNLAPAPRESETDLGDQTIDGTILHGTQKQRTVGVAASGTGSPVTITDEYWYSPDLSIYLIIKHNDPRTGEQIVAVTHIDRQEPPAQRFLVPAGFKTVDETPPPPVPLSPKP